jgi:hypothetical protein
MKFSAGASSEDRGFFELLAETEQARSRGLDLERFLRMSPVERVAWRWALLNEKTLDEIFGLANCKVVRYEELCERPLEVSRELFGFADVSWSEQAERFISRSTTRDDRSYYGVFKDPRHSANKWRGQLPQEVVDTILEAVSTTPPGRLYASEQPVSARP